ncbi:MAG: hypothetical protein EA393_15170 [Bacteroidetes bacterium]|nr:MAG: hypothetical protein EA393_15170 [Bacteroidota bacterium]
MKILIAWFFGLCLLFAAPYEIEAQSRSPIQDRRPSVRPPSRSRPPGGTRRPLTYSRRDLSLMQFGWDFGFNIGTSHSLTDVSGNSTNQSPSFLNTQWSTTSLNAGVFARYRFHPNFAARAAFNYGKIHGADSLAEGRVRNFYFNNQVYEFAAIGELYIPKTGPAFPLDIYGYLGLAVFFHDPVLTVPDPENFEFDDFSNVQPAIPMGLGISYNLPYNFRVGYEVGWRKTFTDHLDGFTRRWSRGNDSYYFNKVKISYFIPDGRRRW